MDANALPHWFTSSAAKSRSARSRSGPLPWCSTLVLHEDRAQPVADPLVLALESVEDLVPLLLQPLDRRPDARAFAVRPRREDGHVPDPATELLEEQLGAPPDADLVLVAHSGAHPSAASRSRLVASARLTPHSWTRPWPSTWGASRPGPGTAGRPCPVFWAATTAGPRRLAITADRRRAAGPSRRRPPAAPGGSPAAPDPGGSGSRPSARRGARPPPGRPDRASRSRPGRCR